ncbi:MAG: hypothetical protein EA355_05375 [Rhodobacteraceae bacterium]|nr:MAG: hypothetical protein EA355_05375 [Paracoccaceae bacterium]
MTVYSYKCVAAPRKARKGKGFKSAADAFVAAFETAIAEQAAQGWEYLRTDLVPMEAKHGFFSQTTETHQGVMVFRRPAHGAEAAHPSVAPGASPPASSFGVARPEPAPPSLTPDDEPEIPRLGAARID